jgi:hypothetical protein
MLKSNSTGSRGFVRALVLSLTAQLFSCSEAEKSDPTVPPAPSPSPVTAPSPSPVTASPASGQPAAPWLPLAQPYPRARWRLVPPGELDQVVLWLSHILIRHDRVPSDVVSFSYGDWHAPHPKATRSREDAFVLAEQIAVQASLAPDEFAELARKYSEDPVTRASGGSLGGVRASNLAPLYGLLDMVAATEVGAVARVVETPHGFHVFQRQKPPPEQIVSGSRIIIGHTDAQWLGILYPERKPTRSRAEALALANEVYERARRSPNEFAALVARHSEHEDVVQQGDFGAWSNLESTPFAREIEQLQGLAVGEVGPPLDTLFGIQLIQRTPNRPRTEYRLTTIRFRFDPSAAEGSPHSKHATLERARAAAARIVAEPSAFSSLQTEYCCKSTFSAVEGRDVARLVQLLAGLREGEVARDPLEFGREYLLPKLVARGVHKGALPDRFELPSPVVLDLDYWLPELEPALFEASLRMLGEKAVFTLSLDTGKAEQLRQEHELSGKPQDRLGAFKQFQGRVQRLLGATEYERYRQLMLTQIEELVLRLD